MEFLNFVFFSIFFNVFCKRANATHTKIIIILQFLSGKIGFSTFLDVFFLKFFCSFVKHFFFFVLFCNF